MTTLSLVGLPIELDDTAIVVTSLIIHPPATPISVSVASLDINESCYFGLSSISHFVNKILFSVPPIPWGKDATPSFSWN